MPESKSDLVPNLQNSMPAETDSRKETSASSVRDQAIALNQTKNAGFPSPLVILGGVVIAAAFFGSDIPAWSWMFQKWSTSPDDSHGMLVPAFSAWLLWHRKDLAKFAEMNVTSPAMSLGVSLIFLGILLRFRWKRLP